MGSYLVSVIIPFYQEEKHLAQSVGVIRRTLVENGICYQLVLVDDGSKDGTWEVMKALSVEFPEVMALRLSRNFGKEAALCAGLESASGDACIIMDGDLQHPPEIIPQMVRMWLENKYDVVEGVKVSRGKEKLSNKLGAFLFYRILHKMSGFDLKGASDFKLMDAKVVRAWKRMGERNLFFRGMSAWVGFNRTQVFFEVAERAEGTSKWSVVRLVRLAVTAITSFSSLPLQIVTCLGVLFLTGSFLLGLQTLYMKFKGAAVSGFTTVILLLLIIGSTLMISLGIIGTYIARIFDEVKNRPRYLVSELIENRNIN